MKRWFLYAAQIALGAFVSSLALESLTRLAIWQFVPRVHDAQFALFITIIGGIGAILGAVSTISFLLAKAHRFKLAGRLILIVGALSIALSLPQVVQAGQTFNDNNQPFMDALAYVGFTLVWSAISTTFGVFLLQKRGNQTS